MKNKQFLLFKLVQLQKLFGFSNPLDNQLQDVGEKLDIVDIVTVDEMTNMTLKDVLLNPTVD